MKNYSLDDALKIVDKLKNIPHLKIASNLDVENVIPEIDLAVRWDPFKLRKFYKAHFVEEVFTKLPLYVAEGLIDVKDDGTESNFNISLEQTRKDFNELIDYKITDLGRKCPNSIKLIKDHVDYTTKCKFSKLNAKEPVKDWHDHKYVNGNARNFSLHWALKTNEKAFMGVRRNGKEIYQHYAKGELWLLNTWEEHTVINDGDVDRIHLWGAANLYATSPTVHSHNHKLLYYIEKALETYDGPYL
jgi:hypothetical protein